MAPIKIKHVRSFSSEDKTYPADNLLKGDGFKKWKSASVGEKQVSAVLEFEKACEISSIDIGNEGSAFIEILVARASEKSEPDFQVLLVASSFMNPQESRNGQNLNRVRMFDKEKLTKSLLGQKWDLVKIVCTQPFNKNIQYGISFIKFHSPGDDSAKSDEAANSVGFFKMKENKEKLTVGSAFKAYKAQVADGSSASPGASARTASRVADELLAREAALMRNHNSNRADESKDTRKTEDKGFKPESKGTMKTEDKGSKPSRNETKVERKRSPEPRKRSPEPSSKRVKKEVPVRPFSKLMSKVVFAMSGYQNPERGKIRDQACAMGATYKPDWGRGCTHLLCAFENTPKYNTVKGKGRIVNADWIKRCHKERKLLPWRKYRVGRARTPPISSDEECIAEDIAEKKAPATTSNPSTGRESPKPSTSKPAAPLPQEESEDSDYNADTDADVASDTDMDTDDEIQRIKQTKKAATDKPKTKEKFQLAEFLKGFNFLLYGEMNFIERRTLTRIIVAYAGKVEEYMSESVTHVVTLAGWDEKFDKALGENTKLVFVRPDWVYQCDKHQKLVKTDDYCVTSH